MASINPPLNLHSDKPPAVASFLPMAGVQENGSYSPEERPFSEVCRGYTPFQAGDVLLAKITPCFENGKAAYIHKLPFRQGFGSTEFHVLRPGPLLDAKYLYRFLQTPDFKARGRRRMTGSAGQQRVPADFLKDESIPLPPLEEQKRIAAILDKADVLRRKREQAIKLADEFLRSLFLDMFGDPVRNPKGWPVRFFREILSSIEAGTSVGGEQRDRQPGERAVLKISAVTSGIFKPNECKVVDVTSLPPMLVTPQIGDLLFSRANTRELVGATCLVHLHDPDLFLPDKIWRLSCNDELALPAYVHYVLSDDRFRKEFTKIATGTSGSMLNISQQKLLAYRLPVPPLPIQQSFAKAAKSTMLLRQKLIDLGIEASDLGSCLTSLAFRDGTSLWH